MATNNELKAHLNELKNKLDKDESKTKDLEHKLSLLTKKIDILSGKERRKKNLLRVIVTSAWFILFITLGWNMYNTYLAHKSAAILAESGPAHFSITSARPKVFKIMSEEKFKRLGLHQNPFSDAHQDSSDAYSFFYYLRGTDSATNKTFVDRSPVYSIDSLNRLYYESGYRSKPIYFKFYQMIIGLTNRGVTAAKNFKTLTSILQMPGSENYWVLIGKEPIDSSVGAGEEKFPEILLNQPYPYQLPDTIIFRINVLYDTKDNKHIDTTYYQGWLTKINTWIDGSAFADRKHHRKFIVRDKAAGPLDTLNNLDKYK
jgi:hypothetical protein